MARKLDVEHVCLAEFRGVSLMPYTDDELNSLRDRCFSEGLSIPVQSKLIHRVWHEQARRAQMHTLRGLGELLGPLEVAGITSVRVEFSGSGDEGFCTEDHYKPHDPPDRLKEQVWEEFTDHAHTLTTGNWWDNEGGQGHFELDVQAQELTVHCGYNHCVEAEEWVPSGDPYDDEEDPDRYVTEEFDNEDFTLVIPAVKAAPPEKKPPTEDPLPPAGRRPPSLEPQQEQSD